MTTQLTEPYTPSLETYVPFETMATPVAVFLAVAAALAVVVGWASAALRPVLAGRLARRRHQLNRAERDQAAKRIRLLRLTATHCPYVAVGSLLCSGILAPLIVFTT